MRLLRTAREVQLTCEWYEFGLVGAWILGGLNALGLALVLIAAAQASRIVLIRYWQFTKRQGG